MPRRDISMTAEEIDAFLGANREAVVAANHPDGGTLATVAAYSWRDGVITVELPADEPVLAALRADDRACVAVEQFPSYTEIRAVVVHGPATIVRSYNPIVAVRIPLGPDTVSFDFAKQQLPNESAR